MDRFDEIGSLIDGKVTGKIAAGSRCPLPLHPCL